MSKASEWVAAIRESGVPERPTFVSGKNFPWIAASVDEAGNCLLSSSRLSPQEAVALGQWLIEIFGQDGS